MQIILNRVYDGGPYRRGAVDYGQPPTPPLRDAERDWARNLFDQAHQEKP
ncbi:MAG: DUF4058 family protein [Gemmataceae bacterium]